ncbi:YheC/YheD family protein [Paenibacillus spongiae]|uniref:YheC/YheD family protein n=1 Tax=Paenibacillus spongiae TaxID=2909671 RepID=A0ABY5SFH2_9BACL|nr:YheC/YheD family protein [Paenibacillus spongiae]UVI31018.1 YheC/YheD family protein [Paenibacillus spongiae]
MSYRSTSVKSKWTKTKWLNKNANLRKYVPQTLPFSRSNLSSMLSQYSTVFFKPTGGSGGFNIVRIKKLANGYQTQHNTVKTRYSTFDALFGQLKQRSRQRPYLLQKGINLAKTKGRPFDIRVMIQKSNAGAWKCTGIFTKIGRPGKVATNYNQGGNVGFLQQTLSGSGYSQGRIEKKRNELINLGLSVGRLFDQHLRGFRELGLDVALDGEGRSWILEVNTRPQFYPLKKFKDKSMYREMLNYGKQYGRKK